MIYLDSAATSLLKPPAVAEAVKEAVLTMGNDGRGAYGPALHTMRVVYDTRRKLAALFGISDPSRIAFTSNVTQSLNMAIQGLIGAGEHVITSVCEHNSVLRPLYERQQKGSRLTILSADQYGRISYEELEQAFCPDTKAVVLAHASNVTGNQIDLKTVSELAHRHGALLIVDAAQTAGAAAVNVTEAGIDILCFTGHKSLLGPQGVGGIYVREGIHLPPMQRGGSGVHSFSKTHPDVMPVALEAGTLNGPGIAGLNAAMDFLFQTGIAEIEKREAHLARMFYLKIKDIPGIRFYGDYAADSRAPIVTLNLGDEDAGEISDLLWEEYQICVRPGAHCAPLIHEHFGTQRQGAVRFSFSYFNTEEEVELAAGALREIAQEIQG